MYSFNRGLLRPLQVRSELARMVERVAETPPRRILEIGTSRGGTLYLLARAARSDAVLVSVDLPLGPWGGVSPTWREWILPRVVKEGQTLHFLRGSSHDPKTVERAVNILGAGLVDVLMIDGDHSYSGVKQDFDMYAPMVRAGGLVIFHDIVPHPPRARCEVSRFWGEVKAGRRYEEIIENPKQGWAGIGILHWNVPTKT